MSCELRIPHLEDNEYLYPKTTPHKYAPSHHSFADSQLRFSSPRFDSFKQNSMTESTSTKFGSMSSTRRLGEISATWALDRKNQAPNGRESEKLLIQELEEACEKDNSEAEIVDRRERCDRIEAHSRDRGRDRQIDTFESRNYNEGERKEGFDEGERKPVRYNSHSYIRRDYDVTPLNISKASQFNSRPYTHREVENAYTDRVAISPKYDTAPYTTRESYKNYDSTPHRFELERSLNRCDLDRFPQRTEIDSFTQGSEPNRFPQRTEVDRVPQRDELGIYPQRTESDRYPQRAEVDRFPQGSELDRYPQRLKLDTPHRSDLEITAHRHDLENFPHRPELDTTPHRLELELDSMINSINRVALILKRQDYDITLDKLPEDYSHYSIIDKLLLSRTWTQSLYQDFLLKPKPKPSSRYTDSTPIIETPPNKPIKSKSTKRAPQPSFQAEESKCEDCTKRGKGRRCEGCGNNSKKAVGEPKLRRYPSTKRKLKSLTKKYFV